MADYFTPTVVQQTLPLADMTSLEKLVLKVIFETEEIDGQLYCFASESVSDFPSLDAAEVRDALKHANGIPSRLRDLVKTQADALGDGEKTLDLDLTAEGFEFILQDILKRSETLNHISVTSAFTCSKMRPDGFGGMVTLITPDEILSMSTNAILEKWLAYACP
jgi:hypothetical protein